MTARVRESESGYRPYRVLVTGSRDWSNVPRVIGHTVNAAIMMWVRQPGRRVVFVHGGCPTGVDAAVDRILTLNRDESWAALCTVERHPARWASLGRSAGPRRNAEMVAAGADVCLAFIRNGSRGATHCADLAEKAGIPTRRFTETDP